MALRVLFISNSSGGMYSFRREILQTISMHFETFLSAPNDAHGDYWETINCNYIPYVFNRHGTNPINEIGQIRYYQRLLRRINPALVFTYTIKPNVYGGIACARQRIPYIANVTGLGDAIENGGIMHTVAILLYRAGLKKASCVFFQNESNRQYFLKNRIVSGKTRRIPGSGVNLSVHQMETYPIIEDEIKLLYIARIKRDKGIRELLEAIKTVRKDFPNCHVDILGVYEDDYSKQIGEAEARGDIRFHGYQSDVHKFYKNAHCVVLPSYHEGLSNVLLEGSATGRPVITTRVPGCKETFDEGISGFGCEPKDVESLVTAIKKFINLSQAEKEAMGLAARRKMEAEFDRQLVISAYLEEMNQIVIGE